MEPNKNKFVDIQKEKIVTLVANINMLKHLRLPFASPSAPPFSLFLFLHITPFCPLPWLLPESEIPQRLPPAPLLANHATGRLPGSQGRDPANTSLILRARRCPTFPPDLRDPHRHRRAFPGVRRPARTSQILLRTLSSPTCSSWFAENGGRWY
jgi:hypothetical protein